MAFWPAHCESLVLGTRVHLDCPRRHYALDDRCSISDSLVSRNGVVIHRRRLCSHFAVVSCGRCVDPYHSRTKSSLDVRTTLGCNEPVGERLMYSGLQSSSCTRFTRLLTAPQPKSLDGGESLEPIRTLTACGDENQRKGVHAPRSRSTHLKHCGSFCMWLSLRRMPLRL